MTGLRFVAAMAWRETRGARRRQGLLIATIAVGVAALVAINSFTDNLQRSVRGQARELLGADLSLSRSTPWSEEVEEMVDGLARDADHVHGHADVHRAREPLGHAYRDADAPVRRRLGRHRA